MAQLWLNRITKEQRRSVAPADMPPPLSDWIEEPDLSAVDGFPSRYWEIAGDAVLLMDQASRDALDAVADQAAIDRAVSQLDPAPDHDLLRAISAETVFLINQLRNAHSQPPITGAQFRAAVRARL